MYVPDKNALTFKLQINPQYKSHKRRKSESAYEMPDVKFLVTTTFCQSSMFLLKKKREKCLDVLLSVVCYSFRSSRTSILIVSHNICISFFSNPYHLLIASHVKIKSDNAYKIPELKFIVTTYIFFSRSCSPKRRKFSMCSYLRSATCSNPLGF